MSDGLLGKQAEEVPEHENRKQVGQQVAKDDSEDQGFVLVFCLHYKLMHITGVVDFLHCDENAEVNVA